MRSYYVVYVCLGPEAPPPSFGSSIVHTDTAPDTKDFIKEIATEIAENNNLTNVVIFNWKELKG